MKAKLGRVGRNARIAIVSLALVGAGPAAAADDYGWIAGFGTGQAKQKDFRLPTTNYDDTDTVVSAFGGYQFTRYFAMAGGYLDLGKFHAQGTASFGPYDQTMKVDGFHVFGVGSYPVADRVSVTGTLGAYRWNYKFSEPAIGVDPARSLSDSGVSPTFGIGVNIDIFSKRGTYLHIGWQRFLNVGNRNTVEHENDYDLFMVGVVYNFSKLMEGKAGK
jgi:OOP family OmpA-OmpF porin